MVNGQWRYSVYDIGGNLVAEYGQQQITSDKIRYYLQDHQASTRVVMNNSASVISRTDYQAFGEEISSGVGRRTTSQGYSQTDNNRQRYAMTERDEATALEHTWFRKYDNLAGRWTSPDPSKESMSLGNPQSFNRYSYVENDPVNAIDPSGLFSMLTNCQSIVVWDGERLTFVWGERCTLSWGSYDPVLGNDDGVEGGGGGSPTPQQNDCQRFADRVAEIAARHTDVGDFVDELARVFVGLTSSDVDEMLDNANNSVGERFNSTGFNAGLFDDRNDNQARHFMGGLIAGYKLGAFLGKKVMDHNENSSADLALNVISTVLGAGLTNPSPARTEPASRARDDIRYKTIPANPGFKALADKIRSQVCASQP